MQCQHHPCPDCAGGPCCQPKQLRLRRSEADFLLRFAELPFLPAVRFTLRRYGEPAQEGDTLAPVYLREPSEPLEELRRTAAILERLAGLGLVSISYTEPLGHFNYSDYVNSSAFTEFRAQAKGFAVPELEYGSMALTALGQEAIDDLELAVLPSTAVM